MAAGTVLAPPPMYRVRPYFEIKKVRLPNCMYQMKPLHKLTGMKTGSDEIVGPALSYLEQRQEWVLNQITHLQERVKSLGETLGVSPEDVGILTQATALSSTEDTVGGSMISDVVISCPPSQPPYPLISLCHHIAQRGVSLSCHLHVHSSVTQKMPAHLMEFWKGLPESTSNPRLRITLLWKDDVKCRQPTMVVSVHNQTPVKGIANISRYICRQFCPQLYEGNGHEQAALVDSWLDAVAGTFIYGSSKEKTSILRRLNSHLGSSQYLVGKDVTLADIVAYTIICGASGEQKLSDNVKKWIKSCQSRPEFQNIPTVQNLTGS